MVRDWLWHNLRTEAGHPNSGPKHRPGNAQQRAAFGCCANRRGPLPPGESARRPACDSIAKTAPLPAAIVSPPRCPTHETNTPGGRRPVRLEPAASTRCPRLLVPTGRQPRGTTGDGRGGVVQQPLQKVAVGPGLVLDRRLQQPVLRRQVLDRHLRLEVMLDVDVLAVARPTANPVTRTHQTAWIENCDPRPHQFDGSTFSCFPLAATGRVYDQFPTCRSKGQQARGVHARWAPMCQAERISHSQCSSACRGAYFDKLENSSCGRSHGRPPANGVFGWTLSGGGASGRSSFLGCPSGRVISNPFPAERTQTSAPPPPGWWARAGGCVWLDVQRGFLPIHVSRRPIGSPAF
jgi:hypothetical protein